MSEWYDSQGKQVADINWWLQERLESDNPRREFLTNDEAKRLGKLEAIADKLRRGENVQNRQLRKWLIDDEYSEFEEQWQQQLEFRSDLKDKPDELSRYECKLKQAIFNYNRAEGYRSKGRSSTAKIFHTKSEKFSEEAIEILHEILHSNPHLCTWFDRHISFDAEDGIGADVVSLPRLVTSRSNERLREDSRIQSKQAVKLRIVEQAIFSIGR